MASFRPALTEAPQRKQPHWDPPVNPEPRPCLIDVGFPLSGSRDRTSTSDLKRHAWHTAGPATVLHLYPPALARGGPTTGVRSISPDGRNVYVGSYDSDAVVTFERDKQNGTLEPKPGPTGCAQIDETATDCATASALDSVSSVTVSPDGNNVYVTSHKANALSIFDRR